MDLFPNLGFVRLRNRARDKYMHADEDARGVSLRRLGATPSVNAVWKAERWAVEGEGGDDAFLVLQSAAYGRYLAVSNVDAPSGHRGVRVLQQEYISPYLEDPFVWTPHKVEADQSYVRLHNGEQRCLRANGKHRHWKNLVTADDRKGDETTMMQWRVEAIPLSPDPIPLPPPPQPPIHVSRGLFRRWAKAHPYPGRMIRHMRSKDDGRGFTSDSWPDFEFYDCSVSNLRTEVAARQDDENITLGVRAGMYAQIIPLITDLPHNVHRMDIIVITTGSQASEMLQYPQFDVPEPQVISSETESI